MCGYRHHHEFHHVVHHHHDAGWDRSRRDPSLRVSDAEREEVATLLRDHAAEGRLTPEELDERLERAFSARTRGDLDALMTDLPRKPPAPDHGVHLRSLSLVAGVVLLLAALVLAAGAGFIWPVWVLGFFVFTGVRRGRMRGAHWI
jgi:uncharacterized protein DUF1707